MGVQKAQASPTKAQDARDVAATFSLISSFRADASSCCARLAPLIFASTWGIRFPRLFCAHFAPRTSNSGLSCAQCHGGDDDDTGCAVGVNQMEQKLSAGKPVRQANVPTHESAARAFQKEPREDSENVQQRIMHGLREVSKK